MTVASSRPHLVVVSALGGERSVDQLSWFGRLIYRRVVGADRLAEVSMSEDILVASQVTATLIRAPKLDDKPPTGVHPVALVSA